MMPTVVHNRAALRAVRLVHTIAWAFFAGCIVLIPLAASRDSFRSVLILGAIVLVEVAILALNGWRCPLTPLAARYTSDRRDNFDIYLPRFVARYNRLIFGWLFAAGIVYSLIRWRVWR